MLGDQMIMDALEMILSVKGYYSKLFHFFMQTWTDVIASVTVFVCFQFVLSELVRISSY